MSTPSSVLITGTSSGFGFLTAKTLVGKGHTVFASMRNVEGKNAEAAAALRDAAAAGPGTLHVIELDVTSDESVARAAAQVFEHGELDVLVNNAGINALTIVEAFTPAQVHAMFDVNVVGVHRVSRAVLPRMRARGQGLLINISSGLGRWVLPFLGPYVASKFAVEALSDSYRYELSPSGVEVSVVQPGAFATELSNNSMQPGDQAALEGNAVAVGIAQAMWSGFGEMMANAPSPQLVADAIAELVAAPLGQRPQRVAVDPMTGSFTQTANRCHEEIQTQMFTSMQLGGLLETKPRT